MHDLLFKTFDLATNLPQGTILLSQDSEQIDVLVKEAGRLFWRLEIHPLHGAPPSARLSALRVSIAHGLWDRVLHGEGVTDEQLAATARNAHRAEEEAAHALRELHPLLRPLAMKEGRCRMVMSRGCSYSQAVQRACHDVNTGLMPYADADHTISLRDPHGVEARRAASHGISFEQYMESMMI